MNENRYPYKRNVRVSEDVLRRIIAENAVRDGVGARAEQTENQNGCTIGSTDALSLAMVCSPIQNFCSLYTEENGFLRGTIFSQLDKPFSGDSISRAKRRIQ